MRPWICSDSTQLLQTSTSRFHRPAHDTGKTGTGEMAPAGRSFHVRLSIHALAFLLLSARGVFAFLPSYPRPPLVPSPCRTLLDPGRRSFSIRMSAAVDKSPTRPERVWSTLFDPEKAARLGAFSYVLWIRAFSLLFLCRTMSHSDSLHPTPTLTLVTDLVCMVTPTPPGTIGPMTARTLASLLTTSFTAISSTCSPSASNGPGTCPRPPIWWRKCSSAP